jgi:general secretion pathway protein C
LKSISWCTDKEDKKSMNKRLPLLLSLIGLVLLAVSLAYWILQLYQPPQRPLAAVPRATMPDPPIDAAATLFGGQLAVASATNYQLTGVISSGRDSVAILVADGAPAKALKVGREISPGVKLVEVYPRYVMLSDGGAMKRVDLAQDTKPAAAMGGAPNNAPPANLPPPTGPLVGQPGSSLPATPPQLQQQPEPPAQPAVPPSPDQNTTPEPPMSPGAVQQPNPAGPHTQMPGQGPSRVNGTQVIQAPPNQ